VSQVNPQAGAAAGTHDDSSPFGALLRQRAACAAVPEPGRVIIGTLQAIPAGTEPGAAEVAGLGSVAVTHSVVPLSAAHVGHGVALSVLEGGRALVLGLLWEGATAVRPQAEGVPTSATLAVTVDGHREVIQAARELELRCGDACIVLTADGRIQLRGTYITSHASATQRLVGGSVHVN
jgi:hypothetical protein